MKILHIRLFVLALLFVCISIYTREPSPELKTLLESHPNEQISGSSKTTMMPEETTAELEKLDATKPAQGSTTSSEAMREEFDLRPLQTKGPELKIASTEAKEEPREQAKKENTADASGKNREKSRRSLDSFIPLKAKTGSSETQGEIDFTFDNEELAEVVKRYAEKKGINPILPQGAQAMTQRITFKPSHAFTMEETERYLSLFLDLAGYAMLSGQECSIVMKNDQNVRRNPLPLYININPELLPDTDNLIRAVYYMNNLKVSDDPNSPLVAILLQTLSGPDSITTDSQSNGIIIADKSRNIRAAMQMVYELDASGSPYVFETIQLFNSSSSYVANFLKTKMLTSPSRGGGDNTSMGTYFSTNLKIVSDDRRNTLIVMGKEAPVNRLKQFIRDAIDAPAESGNSIFHVYDLKYRDAEKFADVLNKVVKGSMGGMDQSTATHAGGPRRFFEDVIIEAETPKQLQQQQVGSDQLPEGSTSTPPPPYRGANRLLVAAQPSDWTQLKKLIDRLDVPQRQVILEVMIVDYERTPVKELTSRLRNPHGLRLFNSGITAQSAQETANYTVDSAEGTSAVGILPIIDPNLNNQAIGIDGDLLRLLTETSSPTSTVISSATPGSLILSFNDDNTGILGILRLLDSVGKSKVISNPYLIVLDNTPALVSNSTIQRAPGEGVGISGGVRVNVEDIPATLQLNITPRISSSERLSLNIGINIAQFIPGGSGYNRNTRSIQTNTNLGSGQLLVLGGLTQTDKQVVVTQVPILGQIPLLGWFFRSTSTTVTETELGIFIRPTILEPKIQEPADNYTQKKMRVHMNNDGTDVEGNPQDPIVRLFFGQDKSDDITPETINNYFSGADVAPEKTSISGVTQKRGRLRSRRRQCNYMPPIDPALKQCELMPCQVR